MNALMRMMRGRGQMSASRGFAPTYDPPGAGGAAAPAPAVGIDEPQIQPVAAMPVAQNSTHGMDFMNQLFGMLSGSASNTGMVPQAQVRGLPQSRPMGGNPLMMFMQNLRGPRGR